MTSVSHNSSMFLFRLSEIFFEPRIHIESFRAPKLSLIFSNDGIWRKCICRNSDIVFRFWKDVCKFELLDTCHNFTVNISIWPCVFCYGRLIGCRDRRYQPSQCHGPGSPALRSIWPRDWHWCAGWKRWVSREASPLPRLTGNATFMWKQGEKQIIYVFLADVEILVVPE